MRKGQEELGHQRDPETICTIFLVPIFLHIFLSADIYVKKKPGTEKHTGNQNMEKGQIDKPQSKLRSRLEARIY